MAVGVAVQTNVGVIVGGIGVGDAVAVGVAVGGMEVGVALGTTGVFVLVEVGVNDGPIVGVLLATDVGVRVDAALLHGKAPNPQAGELG